jgi:cytochrome c
MRECFAKRHWCVIFLFLFFQFQSLHAEIIKEPGSVAFETCASCHSLKPGENGTGPSLHALWGRKAGSLEGFRFSGPLRRSQWSWDDDQLFDFLMDPQKKVPGNRMPFSGMSDEKLLKELIQFLKKQTVD